MSASDAPLEVTVYIASAGTVACTELTVRTALARAGMAHELVVGDAGSTDGSVEMLTSFRDRGVLRLELVDGPRHHSAWLDHWLDSCPTRWAVFVDSDIEFHRDNWLRELVEVARQGDHALVCSELLPACPHAIEPVDGNEVYLAPRPAPWLMLVDCARVRALELSFGFLAEASAERPEGLIAYDTGAKLFAELQTAGLRWTQMPPSFARGYTHFANMSWAGADTFGAGRTHRAKLRRVQRRLRRARRADASARRGHDDAEPDLGERVLTRDDVKSRAVSGVALLLGRGLAVRILGLLGSVVLARLLVPEDFGLIAIGLSIVALGQMVGGAGLGEQLVSREQPPTERELRAVTGVQLAITSAVGTVGAVVGLIVGGAALATALMMVALPISAVRSPAVLLFTRRLEFSRTVWIEISEVITYLLCAIALAACGLGVWSLALATVLRAVVGALVAVRLSPVGLVVPSWDLEAIRPMLSFGARFQLATIVYIGHDIAFTAGVAAIGGLLLLGLWSFAWRILQAPFMLFEALANVGFPTLARLYGAGDDDAAMTRVVEGLATGLCIAMAIVMCPIVASAPAAVPVIFGAQWAGVADILPGAGLALVMGAPITTVLFSLLYARGDAQPVLRATVIDAVVRLTVTMALLRTLGASAIGIGWAVSVVAGMTVTLPAVRRHVNARLSRCIVTPCLLGAIAAAGGWWLANEMGPTVSSMLASAAVSGLVLPLLLALFAPRQLRQALAMVRSAYRVWRGREAAAAP